MAASRNLVILVGRIGQDPEKRLTQGGTSVINFSLATSEYSKEKEETVTWHRIVAWGKTADNIEKFCHKGSLVYLEGSLQNREWTDKDSNKRQTTEVNARIVQFLDSKNSSGGQGGNHPHDNNQYSGIEDDIPY